MKMTSKHEALVDLAETGGYTLPAEVTTAHRALTALRAHRIPPVVEDDPEVAAVAALLSAARSGGPMLTRVPAGKAGADRAAATSAERALTVAQAEALAVFDGEASDRAEAIITDHLAPVHDEVVAEATVLAAKAAGVVTRADVARADSGTRAAVVRLDDLAVQWTGLREVWDRLVMHLAASGEGYRFPGLARFYTSVQEPGAQNPGPGWPEFLTLQHQARSAAAIPWQQGSGRDRLLWLAANPQTRPWLPTPAQVNARVEVAHRQDLADAEESRLRVQAAHATGAGRGGWSASPESGPAAA